MLLFLSKSRIEVLLTPNPIPQFLPADLYSINTIIGAKNIEGRHFRKIESCLHSAAP